MGVEFRGVGWNPGCGTVCVRIQADFMLWIDKGSESTVTGVWGKLHVSQSSFLAYLDM